MHIKKLFLSLLVVLGTLLYVPCFAQFNVYHPFPDSNAVWGETSYNGSCGTGVEEWGDNYIVNGDTMVNGLMYHKVYQNAGFYSSTCTSPWYTYWYYSNSFYGAYREDTMKHIYACCTSYLGSHDSLLYDFNLNVGDTLKQFNAGASFAGKCFVVETIDSVLVNGAYRKRFNCDTLNQLPGSPSLIEGIGSTQGLFDFMVYPFEVYSTLNCFSQNGKTIWSSALNDSCGLYYLDVPTIKQTSTNISVYPNPSNGVFNLGVSNKGQGISEMQIEIYNVMGQEIYSTPLSLPNWGDLEINLSKQPNGVYFYRVMDENSNLIREGKLIIQK